MPAITTASLIEAAVLGIALAMDAMAVTLSNSLCEPDMPMSKKLGMPIAFALFQMGMPVLGYLGGTLIAEYIERYCRHRLPCHSRICWRQDDCRVGARAA